MSNKEEKIFSHKISKYRVVCKCSHTIIMPNADRKICSHCGNWVYRTPEIEFKYKLQEKMKDNKNE